MSKIGSGIVIACTLYCAAALAQTNGNEFDEAENTKELTKAMQNAQLLLSELSDGFECDYAGYDVTPTDMGNRIIYMVVIVVENETCDDLVKALNYEGAGLNLAFVSEKEMPDMKPLPRSPRPYQPPPEDYTLIHEINPTDDQ